VDRMVSDGRLGSFVKGAGLGCQDVVCSSERTLVRSSASARLADGSNVGGSAYEVTGRPLPTNSCRTPAHPCSQHHTHLHLCAAAGPQQRPR
jgi:hypothetical protein